MKSEYGAKIIESESQFGLWGGVVTDLPQGSELLPAEADVEKDGQVADTGLGSSATAWWRQNLDPWGYTAHF